MQKESPQAAAESDQFVDFFEKTLVVVKANKDKVILGISGVVLLLAIISGVGLYKQKASKEASLAFQALKADFQALVESEGRETALSRWLGNAAEDLGRMKGGASSYNAALLWYGGLAFEKGDFQSASEWYGIAARGFDSGGSLQSIAWCGQGLALEQLGQPDEAAPLYEKIRKSGATVKRDEATFHLARILESRGEAGAAEALYREIAEGDSASPYKELAAEKIAGL